MLRMKSRLLIVARKMLLCGLTSVYLPHHIRLTLPLLLYTSVTLDFDCTYRGPHSPQPQGFVHAISSPWNPLFL